MLEPYVDGPKGFKLYAPSGWNKFDADPGVYDAKWQDIIEPFETVQISSSPVQTATSIDALGQEMVESDIARVNNPSLRY